MSSILKTSLTRLGLIPATSLTALFFSVVGLAVVLSQAFRLFRVVLDLAVRRGTSLKKFGAGKGAWAVITGASDGIGREFAFQLAKAGFNVLLASRSAEKLGVVAAEIETKYGVLTRTQAIDFAAGEPKAYEAFKKTIDELDVGVLVNNVGRSHSMPVPFEETPLEELDNIIEININATLRVTQIVLPKLIANKKGLILNIGSFAGYIPSPFLATYSGSKAFLVTWTQALAEEVREKGVTVELVNTYFVVSALSKIRRPTSLIPLPSPFVRAVLRRINLRGGAVGRPYTSTPYWSHALLDWLIGVLNQPAALIRYNAGMQKDIRRRALRKAEREKGGKTE